EWIKYCAGDDILEKNILEVYINYANSKPNVSCMYSNIIEFKDTFSEGNLLPIKDISSHAINKPDITALEQFNILLKNNPVWAATLFIKRDALLQVNGYNEMYKFFEDRPVLLSLTKNGYKIHFLNIIGAYYRRHKKSIQVKEKDVFISGFEEDRQRFFIKEYINYYTKREQFKMKYLLAKNMIIKKITGNSNNLVIKSISKILELPLKFL
ncbi:MAG TPA: hypothetical protein P5239_07190, partial [Victivallales bacterium]|nr:hypothetical protein [Victivallales bacterium]